jgi:hypothetical protein
MVYAICSEELQPRESVSSESKREMPEVGRGLGEEEHMEDQPGFMGYAFRNAGTHELELMSRSRGVGAGSIEDAPGFVGYFFVDGDGVRLVCRDDEEENEAKEVCGEECGVAKEGYTTLSMLWCEYMNGFMCWAVVVRAMLQLGEQLEKCVEILSLCEKDAKVMQDSLKEDVMMVGQMEMQWETVLAKLQTTRLELASGEGIGNEEKRSSERGLAMDAVDSTIEQCRSLKRLGSEQMRHSLERSVLRAGYLRVYALVW